MGLLGDDKRGFRPASGLFTRACSGGWRRFPILPPPSGKNYFPTDSNGLVKQRTTGQVLYLAYLAYGLRADATSGGFVPNGVNGKINTSSASARDAPVRAATGGPRGPVCLRSGVRRGLGMWDADSLGCFINIPIVAQTVTQATNDKEQLMPTVEVIGAS